MNKLIGVKKSSVIAIALMVCGLASFSGHGAVLKGTPADGAIVNKERVLYWLIQHGDVNEGDSEEVKAAAVQAFIERSGRHEFKLPRIEVQAEKNRAKLFKSVKSPINDAQKAASQTLADSQVTKTVKVLAVLIDFPDLPFDANRLKAGDTDMFYNSYPNSHYKNLLFSTTGFNGPQSQNLQSGYQYFQAASGGSFFFTGEVMGWYRASNNAAFYGGNDAANDDNDKAVPALIKEAVTQAVAGMSAETLNSYDIEDPYDLDGDLNTEESDGIIDHVMVFHSSIGEEAGGGVLKDDAIWSHRYFVDQASNGYSIPGKTKKLFGYTIQPIDAATGVCTHEFGHDLGLPDEYDTSKGSDGSPVGLWSLMSGGSWVGALSGTQPSGFSPYAKSYLQQRYKGKWVNEQRMSLDSLNDVGVDLPLSRAVDSDNVNQISVALPPNMVAFKEPFSGQYQYYSGQGDLLNNALSFDLTLPDTIPLTLNLKAHWNIEQDYDYMQLLVDGVAIVGNHTQASNPKHSSVKNYISGTSASITGATGTDSWVELSYDLSPYAGLSKKISLVYVTDEASVEYGMAIDDIRLLHNTNELYKDGAESAISSNGLLLNGFSRVTNTRPGKDRRYLIQLRDHSGIDAGLEARGYEPGVLIWLENLDQSDNNVFAHEGEGLIGVIDADQEIIGDAKTTSTDVQIRDAAFSLYSQKTYPSDAHLANSSLFDDSQDYSAPLKPMAGMKLDELGFTMEVITQATDSSSAIIRLKKANGVTPEPSALDASFTAQITDNKVSFTLVASGGSGGYSYLWGFGVANASSVLAAPEYTYGSSGDYSVSLTVTDSSGAKVTSSQVIRVVIKPIASFTFTKSDLQLNLQAAAIHGFGSLAYTWDFGDNSNLGSGTRVSHTYAAAGSYTVQITVTDSLGNSHSSAQVIAVTAPSVVTPAIVTPVADTGGGGSLTWLMLVGLGFAAGCRRFVSIN
ncbi:immune inhibitor A domain-containing protein [Shewanella sp. SR44-3]|uniref:immune inhibitor A domain-containing protein n=1 Tax=Shewanella sp. SR44-3 TaxID=2760936 RepID=UPI0015FC3F27|nr:immune inhibitor A domain-containing protein [Shewanella sp. SR44-3]MBB1268810.1 immune inhibitor A [Shewanella sp. SR44-3]